MTDVTADIVDRLIAHAQSMLDGRAYDWPTSRAALERILVDLETRSVDDPNVQRLRRLTALRDDAWKARHDRGRRHGQRRDRLDP